MTIKEFEKLTGFFPSSEDYATIEQFYYDYAGEKEDFCKAYKKNENGIAESIQIAINTKRAAAKIIAEEAERETNEKHTAEVADLKKQVSKLQSDLDRELEWKPCDGMGTNLNQRDYERLAGCGREMSDEEARRLISDEFGFSPDKIKIVRKVNAYEVNKHHYTRRSAEYERVPLYDATDWNYIRFDVHCAGAVWCYEMVNCSLREYFQ